MDFKETVASKCLVTDGAMGTYYAQKYALTGQAPECDNLENPEKIETIHREYIKAGADILRTNSFASNKETLIGRTAVKNMTEEEGLHKIYENVFASYKIAEKAVKAEKEEAKAKGETFRPIYIAGDIGPVPEHGVIDENELFREYQVMAKAHLAAGAKLIWFETFAELKRIVPVIRWIKEVSDAFVMVSFSVNKFGYTKAGVSASNLIKEVMEEKTIDGIGFNCGVGPAHLKHVLSRQDFGDLIVFAAPNAGYADKIYDRSVYRENADYFCGEMKAAAAYGINIIGGCCGTNPSYIEALAKELGHKKISARIKVHRTVRQGEGLNDNSNPFLRQLYSGKKVIIAELDPPHDGNDKKMLDAAFCLKEAGVEMITFSDSPMGKMRADSMMSAIKVAGEVQIDTMPHISCRDKNVIGMGASFLGAYMNGIRNFLIVTGDPVPSGDRDMITPVYDFTSARLMNYIKQMNEEHFREDPIVYGGALNYGRKNIDVEIERMKKKCEAGASYFLTQPIYSDEDIDRIRYIKKKTDTKILCGILPLVSYRNALFMKNEVTGIRVPDEVVQRYSPKMSREEAEQTGIEIASEIAEKLADTADGYYFMVPFNRASMIAKIMKRISEK